METDKTAVRNCTRDRAKSTMAATHGKAKTAQGRSGVTEIVRNGVIAVTEEMKTNLMRTAYNMIIYEALDFTVGLFTPHGETVSIGIGLPMFIRGMAETVKAKIRHFGRDGMQAGRHLRHQRRLHHRQPSQPRHADPADLPQAASWSAFPAAWRIGSTSAARSAA